MKRFSALVIAVIMLFVFTACSSVNEFRTEQARDYINQAGFEIISTLNRYGDYYIFLVYDTTTKVEYILTWGAGSNGFCPYYDENGSLVFYEQV